MKKCVIYSHSTYINILEIQVDYISEKEIFDITLIINNNATLPKTISSKINNIITYDENLPYSARLLDCLKKYNHDYFLFIHDIDILLHVDKDFLNYTFNYMEKNSIDRIDLKYIHANNAKQLIDFYNEIKLIKQDDPKKFIYNVNPSIWNRESFLDILNKFHHKTYRNIEDMDVQNYCQKFEVYKLFSSDFLKCGYFNCVDRFIYLHISHSGRILTLEDNFKTIYGQPFEDVKEYFEKIYKKYKLKITN